MTPEGLRQHLWEAAPDDPDALAREAISRIDTRDYGPFLAMAGTLVQLGLPVDLKPALAAHAWSIDLALLAVEQACGTGDARAALEELARRVAAQDRRRAALAWGAWTRGETDLVEAARTGVHDGSQTAAQDRMVLCEIAILSDEDTEIPFGPGHARLGLLRTWRREGGGALARQVQLQAAALPADGALWSWLADTLILERNHDAARDVVARAAERLPANALPTLRARLLLEAEDPGAARAALAPVLKRPGWQRSPTELALCLRLALLEDAENPGAPAGAPSLARAALRLFPRHGHLQWLAAEAFQRTEGWDDLIAAPQDDPWVGLRHALALGRPDLALLRLDTMPSPTPDARLRLALRRAETLLRLGRPEAAEAALPAQPPSAPARADVAFWRAEIALARRDPQTAHAAIRPALHESPTRMGLILQAARAAFLQGDGVAAQTHLQRFNSLKAAQLGRPEPPDLRDRIVADLVRHGRDPTHPAGAALALIEPPRTTSGTGAIPMILWHFWQGTLSPPASRGLQAWAERHPGWEQRLLTPETAQTWLSRHEPALAAIFARHDQPALRADVLRAALMKHAGGIYADLDEYPRVPVTPWLEGARIVLVLEEGHNTVANNFLASEPGQPLFADLVERLSRRLATLEAPYPWWDSGPAPLTVATQAHRDTPGLRLLSQAQYDACVSTNLPFPHKVGPDHWR